MILGLTGGIASGKSTVSKILKDKNFDIYDADLIAKNIFAQKNINKKIISTFGNDILNKYHNIDKNKLKKIVFDSKDKLSTLNNIIHPEVYKYYQNIKNNYNNKNIIIFDVPLLFESHIDKLCDKTVVIATNPNIQLQRLMKRDNISLDMAQKIINSQMKLKDKINLADYIIENNKNLDVLKKNIENFLSKIVKENNYSENSSTRR